MENGSVMGPLHTVSDYAIQIIKKMQNENIKSWAPKQDITDKFNDHVQVSGMKWPFERRCVRLII